MDIEERVAWIIGVIKKRDGLNNIQLGRILGVNKNTVQAYSKGKGDLKGSALAGIAKHFGINGEWLIAGKDEPFPGAHDKFPEVCGLPGLTQEQRDKISSTVREMTTGYGAAAGAAQKINLDEAWGKVHRILSAGTPLSVALYLNIQQFAAALDTGQELKVCQDQINGLQAQINDLRGQVDRITSSPITTTEPAAGTDKKAT